MTKLKGIFGDLIARLRPTKSESFSEGTIDAPSDDERKLAKRFGLDLDDPMVRHARDVLAQFRRLGLDG